MKPFLNQIASQFRREFWENRVGTLWVPSILAGVAIVMVLIAVTMGRLTIGDHIDDISEWDPSLSENDTPVQIIEFDTGRIRIATDEDFWQGSAVSNPREIMIGVLLSVVVVFQLLALIIMFMYLLNALYTDRKDKSILFWKSLPVSETRSVLVKLIYGVLFIPIVCLMVSVAVQLVYGTIAAWFFSFSEQYTFWQVLGDTPFFKVFFYSFIYLFPASFIWLPLSAWVLFSSALAKRSPLFMALLVPVAIVTIENLIFRTNFFIEAVRYVLNLKDASLEMTGDSWRSWLASNMSISFGQAIANIAVSTALLAGAVWLRNNRFEN